MTHKMKFTAGALWEEATWDLVFDQEFAVLEPGRIPCSHCHSHRVDTYKGTYESHHWTCPRVIVARNEGGYASTGVCADCVLEALNKNAEPLADVSGNLMEPGD